MAYKTDPGYLDLFRDLQVTTKLYFSPVHWQNYTFPASFFEDVQRQFDIDSSDWITIISIAILTTVLRYIFEYGICKVI